MVAGRRTAHNGPLTRIPPNALRRRTSARIRPSPDCQGIVRGLGFFLYTSHKIKASRAIPVALGLQEFQRKFSIPRLNLGLDFEVVEVLSSKSQHR